MVSIKTGMLAVIALTALAVSAFIAYEYLYIGFEMPDNYLFIGNTINTSELYHPDRFSWYTYDQIDYWISKADPPVMRMTFEYDNGTYNGTSCLHKRDTYTSRRGTQKGYTQINDYYFDADGRCFADAFTVYYENGTFRNNGTFNDRNGTYRKMVLNLPYGYRIAPRVRETITAGNKSYDCKKYYLPNQNVDGHGAGPAWLWFADPVPVPVKVLPAQGNVAFGLVDWG